MGVRPQRPLSKPAELFEGLTQRIRSGKSDGLLREVIARGVIAHRGCRKQSFDRASFYAKLSALATLLAIAVALVYFQRPQLVVYSITIGRPATLEASPLYVQNIGAGLLAVDGETGAGFPGGPNSLFLEPQQCVLIAAIHQTYIVFPCRIRPPRFRGWTAKGSRVSLDGRSWVRIQPSGKLPSPEGNGR